MKATKDLPIENLIDTAMNQLQYSYAPYSDFNVGAALLTLDGRIYGGCNVENAAYGPSNCAERTAFFKAVSEGAREFRAICIVGGSRGGVSSYCPPCGVCRQVMAEFCQGDFWIVLARSREDYEIYSLDELLPQRFGKESLEG